MEVHTEGLSIFAEEINAGVQMRSVGHTEDEYLGLRYLWTPAKKGYADV